MDQKVRKYLSEIGRNGGRKSRRTLSTVVAREMVLLREARRAFVKYHAQCFWSYDPNYKIGVKDIQWVGMKLKQNGNLKTWRLGVKLCP